MRNGSMVTGWASWGDYRRDERAVVDLPSGGDIPAALVFTADYSVGMSNLGIHYIYRALAEHGVGVERFFMSPIPYRSVERDTMLERFPVIMAGVSYEGDVLRLADWLARGGVCPKRTERERDDAQLVVVGGAMTYINFLSLAGIADVIVLGDAVSLMPVLADELRRAGVRHRVLERLAEHGAFYVPSIHNVEETTRALHVNKTADIDVEYGTSSWITPRTVFGDTLLVELQRGCIRGCRYCTLPSCFKPMRQRNFELIERDIRAAADRVEFSQVGLVTPEASDYPQLDELLDLLSSLGKGVSFASLRLDGLTAKAIEALVTSGRRSVTVAPETGDDALRASCGKRFTNDEMITKLTLAASIGITDVKLYFMFGLPDETDDALLSSAVLAKRIRSDTGLKVQAAMSPFVPKYGTAWVSKTFMGERELKRRAKILRGAFANASGVSLNIASIKEACTEYAVSWSGLAEAEMIAETAARGGARAPSWKDVDRERAADEIGSLMSALS